MIQNILTFCVKNDLTFVDGSLPSGKLVANDINRNSIYLITPFDNAIVKANFQTNLQSDKPTSALGILVDGKIEVKEIVNENATYYPLVKDWHIYEFKVPSKTLQFISRNRTGQIGINFSIEQRLIPTIKPTYGTYRGEIINGLPDTLAGYYINKTIDFEFSNYDEETVVYNLNDILVINNDYDDYGTKISAYSNRGSTPTTMFSVDPSVLNDNFETIEPSLTAQIVSQVNENVNDIVLILQAIGVSDATLINFGNRISIAEQDIDKIENGTTVVGKALKDDLGNTIKSTYAKKLDLVYSSSNNRIAITLKSYDGTPIDADLIDLPKATTGADGLLAKEDKVKINNIAADISSMGATKQSLSEKNQINGYVGLDGNAKIPSSLLPDSVLGQLNYKGTFDPASGYPATPENGWFYISIGNGTIGGVEYKVGDWAVFNGTTWDKVANSDAVASVNGKLGVVVIDGTDVLVGNGDTFTIEQRIVSMIADINNLIEDIQDGTVVAGKALNDIEGDPIMFTYAANMLVSYNDTNNQVSIELQNKDGNPLVEKDITLPKATTSKDGLMSKEDKAYVDSLLSALLLKVDKNANITGATKTKITYDSKGLVTAGADLVESDIPSLAPSKITQDANNRFVTDNEKSTWNGKQNALTAGDGISISGNVISADSGLNVETWNIATKTLALSDANKLFKCSHTNNQTLTIPTNTSVSFPIGTMITFLLTSTYKVTFSGASGVTLTSMDSLVELATQYGMASLIKTDTDTWQLVGALE